MPKPLCIYHKNCLDGKAAAAVVRRIRPDAELLPMQYTEQAPTVEGREVFVVDFSLTLEGMRALRAQAASVTWIDHHVSSEPISKRLGFGVIDTTTCGSVLAWRTLMPGKPMPAILPFIEDKDLWRWALPDSRAVTAGLNQTFGGADVDKLLDADPVAMAELGRPELAKQAERVRTIVAAGRPLPNAYGLGLRALVVPSNRDQNEAADLVCKPVDDGGLGYDLAVIYYRRKDGRWVHSLRSAGGADCAAIASRYGGGGHPGSACYLSTTPIIPPPNPEP